MMGHDTIDFGGRKGIASQANRTAWSRPAAKMERLEERRFMSAGPGAGRGGGETTGAAADGYEFDLHRPASPGADADRGGAWGGAFDGDVGSAFGATSDRAAIVPPSLPAPTGAAARALVRQTLVAAEFSGAFCDSPIPAGSFTPRVKLWGAQRIDPKQTPVAPESGIASEIQPAHASTPPQARPKPAPAERAPRLLLVEDDEGSRGALSVLLRRQGWEVTAVGTLAEGLQHLTTRPQAVVLDLTLPDGDGEALLRQIRVSGLAARVAVTTGSDDPDRLRELKALHPDLILPKPLNVSALLQSLRGTPARQAA